MAPAIEAVPVTFGAANVMLHTVVVSALTTHGWLEPETPPVTSKSVSP